jgi:hypothetical protein
MPHQQTWAWRGVTYCCILASGPGWLALRLAPAERALSAFGAGASVPLLFAAGVSLPLLFTSRTADCAQKGCEGKERGPLSLLAFTIGSAGASWALVVSAFSPTKAVLVGAGIPTLLSAVAWVVVAQNLRKEETSMYPDDSAGLLYSVPLVPSAFTLASIGGLMAATVGSAGAEAVFTSPPLACAVLALLAVTAAGAALVCFRSFVFRGDC